jgi:hypothetical protein
MCVVLLVLQQQTCICNRKSSRPKKSGESQKARLEISNPFSLNYAVCLTIVLNTPTQKKC